MELVDTHCHIHSTDYRADPKTVVAEAAQDGVTTLICVGTDAADSETAVKFVRNRSGCWASVGIHPHEAIKDFPAHWRRIEALATADKVVAVGECGLDYFYEHSPREKQIEMLHAHFELAIKHKLPMIFHVRDAFGDFWPIYDRYAESLVGGVIHSFTAHEGEVEAIVSRGLYLGINGIATFTKQEWQLEAVKKIPLERLVLETDAPYLTPHPFRGRINEPRHVCVTAEFLSGLRNEALQTLITQTTRNAKALFSSIT